MPVTRKMPSPSSQAMPCYAYSSRGHLGHLAPECISSNLILSAVDRRAANWITEKPVAVWASGSGQLFGRQRLGAGGQAPI